MSEILVTERITGAALDRLRETHDVAYEPDLHARPDALREAVAGVRALIVRNQTRVTEAVLEAAPRLKIVGRAGAGLDNIDTAAAARRGVVVSYTPAENSVSVAELVLGLLLSLVRELPAAVEETRRGGWDRARFTGGELFGKTLGIVGLGRIGRLVAGRARGFGMTLLACDACLTADSPAVRENGARLVSFEELLAEADFVTVHVPLLDSTRGLFGADVFARMKPGAYFVNAARGEVVDEDALWDALAAKRLAGAALDVRATEPPGRDRFAGLDNVLLTPHIGAFTREAQERVVETVCRDVVEVLAGRRALSAYCIE